MRIAAWGGEAQDAYACHLRPSLEHTTVDKRDTFRRAAVAVAICVVFFMSVLGMRSILRLVQYHRFVEEKETINRALQSIENIPPAGISQQRWQSGVWMVIYNGFGNACANPDRISLHELRELRKDIETMISNQPPSVPLMRVIWVRIGECNSSTAEYIQRFTPWLEEEIRMTNSNQH